MLFNPGPTNVSEGVRQAIKTKDICHREKEFSDVLTRVRSKLLQVVNGQDSHQAVAFTASATGANEAVISSIKGKALLIQSGKYSERLKEIAQRHQLSLTELKFNPCQDFSLTEIEKVLRADSDITHILMVHHETTTGSLAPLHEIGKIAQRFNKVLFADTVSSLGGHRIDVKADNLGFCTVNSNKCLESFPGISFVIANKAELEKCKDKSKSFYFDLYNQWKAEERGQTPFTPAVQLFFALDKALDELMEEGIENRIERYRKNAEIMRKGLKELGFEFVLSDELLLSNVVTAIRIPESLDYWRIHDLLKERGQTIYSSEETLKQGIFRVATMGRLEEKDINKFLEDLKDVLSK